MSEEVDYTIEKLIEMANMKHPDLRFVPLKLINIKDYEDMIESKDNMGVLGKMYNTSISGVFTNGEQTKSVAISFLVSVVDIEENSELLI